MKCPILWAFCFFFWSAPPPISLFSCNMHQVWWEKCESGKILPRCFTLHNDLKTKHSWNKRPSTPPRWCLLAWGTQCSSSITQHVMTCQRFCSIVERCLPFVRFTPRSGGQLMKMFRVFLRSDMVNTCWVIMHWRGTLPNFLVLPKAARTSFW